MTGAELLSFVKKNPISIGCGVLSLLLGGGIYYRSGEVPDAEADVAQKTTESERYAANVKDSVQLKEQLEALVTANKEIEHRLLHAGQSLANYQYFYKLESETGTKLTVLNQGTGGTKNPKAAFQVVAFNVTVQGSLPQLIDFLHRLESGAHYCRVLAAACNGGSAGDRNAPVTLVLTIEVLGQP